MKVRILGSAAGGGFPQWNCNCRNCDGVRRGTIKAQARTQSSIAFSNDGDRWTLVNTSPDVLLQIDANSNLRAARALRDTSIAGIILTDSQIDHVTGLLMLRESRAPLKVWCSASVFRDLSDSNPIFRLLAHYCGIDRRAIEFQNPAAEGSSSQTSFTVDEQAGIRLRAISLQSKAPPYSAHRASPQPDDNLAIWMSDHTTGRSILYAPGLGSMSDAIWQAMCVSDCVLVDGTFWTNDEMIDMKLSSKTAQAMGHMPLSGANGMIEWLSRLPGTTRRVLIHINNTNPILDEQSTERLSLTNRQIEVAYDGMEIEL